MNEADLYARSNGLQKNDAAYVLENYSRLVKWKNEGNESILDIGCGSGDVTMDVLLPVIPHSMKKLLGVDVSDKMVEYANKQYRSKKIDFLKMDIASKEMPVDLEEEFDHIFSFYCLHWIQDQEQALKNIYNLLKPGGDILVTFLASNPIFTIYESLQKYNKWAKAMQNLKDFIPPYQKSKNPEKEYDKVLRSAGFSVHLCKVIERNYVYPNAAALRKAVIAVNPFLGKIPENQREDYIQDYIEEVRKMNFMEDNNNNNEVKINTPYTLFVVFASKPC